MGTLSAADSMMTIAGTESAAAGFVLPPALMINFQFKLCKGNPAEIDKAGQAWRDVAQQIQQVGIELREAVAKVPRDDWSADDRTAYEQKVTQFCAQLDIMHAFFQTVGIALTAYAYALFVYAVFAVGMGTFLAALAVTAAAAAASVVGAPIYGECLAIAGTCLTITWGATAVLAAAAQMAAVIFQGGAMLSATLQHFKGNDAALGDLVQAEATGSAAAAANLAQNAANAGLSFVNRGDDLGKVGPRAGSPLKSVDLDADRDSEHTWVVGGGAKVGTRTGTEVEAGGHVRYGDRGWMGGDGEAKYNDVKVKGGYKEDAQGEHTVSGGVEYSHESQRTGHGGKIGVEGEYNVEDHKGEVKGSAGHTYQGGDTTKGTGGVEFDQNEQSGDWDTKGKGEFESWIPGTTVK
jgi:hypothetical protein